MKRLLIAILLLALVVPVADGDDTVGDTAAEAVQQDNRALRPEYELAKQVYTDLAWATYLQASGRLSDAKEAYRKVLDVHESSAFVYTQFANLNLALQDIKTAQEACNRAIEIDPQKPRAYFLLGQIEYRRWRHAGGDLKNAIAAFQKVVELDPNHVEGHRELANLAIQMKNYDLAVQSLKELTRIMPYQLQFHLALGRLYSQLNNRDEAIAAYERVIKIDRDRLQVYKELAQLCAEKYQEFEEQIYNLDVELTPEILKGAEDSLNKTIQIHTDIRRLVRPKDKQAYDIVLRNSRARLGSLHLNTEKTDEAIAVFQGILDEDTEHIDANYGIGLAYQEAGDFEQAEHYLRRTIVLDPNNKKAYRALGFFYLSVQRMEESIAVFLQVLEKDVNDTDAHYALGLAYQEISNFAKAERHLREVIRIDPGNQDAHNALAYLFAERGDNLEEALELVKTALRKSPQNGAYLDSLGWVYYKQGKLDEALTELEKAARYLPDSVEIQDHLGDVYLTKGLKRKAIAVWQKAVQLEPDNMKIRAKLRKYQQE